MHCTHQSFALLSNWPSSRALGAQAGNGPGAGRGKTRYPWVKGRRHRCTRWRARSPLWGLLACDDVMIAGRDACCCRGLGLIALSITGQIMPLCLRSPTVLLIWSINALGCGCHSLVQCLICRWVFAYCCNTDDTWGTLDLPPLASLRATDDSDHEGKPCKVS